MSFRYEKVLDNTIQYYQNNYNLNKIYYLNYSKSTFGLKIKIIGFYNKDDKLILCCEKCTPSKYKIYIHAPFLTNEYSLTEV